MQKPTISAELIAEEIVLNYLHYFYKEENIYEIPELIKKWSECNLLVFLELNNEKRKLFSRKFKNQELADFIKEQKMKDSSFFELACLACVIKVQEFSSLLKVQPTQRKRVVRVKNLSDKIKDHLTEIQIMKYQKHLSWSDIAILLKRNHRYTFEHTKLDPSYIRKVVLRLEKRAQ